MQDPVNEIKGVIRSVVEPYQQSIVAENVAKYFTPDATISNPFLNQSKRSRAKKTREMHVRSVYEVLRLFSINNRVEFNSVMFDKTKEHCTIELVETMDSILHYTFLSNIKIPALIRLDLTQDRDGKYWICKEQNNLPTDIGMIGMILFPGLISLGQIIKLTTAIGTGTIGRFLPIMS